MTEVSMSSAILSAIAFIVIVCTALPKLRYRHWLVRSMDFPRLQIFCVAGLWLLAWFLLRKFVLISWVLPVAVLVCMAYQLRWILPSTRFYKKEVPASTQSAPLSTLKILTSNVLTSNTQYAKLTDLIKQHEPDVFATLESDITWEKALDEIEGYPYTIKCPLDNLYGMHVYSRLPLHDKTTDYLVENDVPSMSARVELSGGDLVRLHVLHPAPPAPGENTYSTERDVELIVLAKTLVGASEPTIVAGDLNDVAWSASTRLFRQLSGLLDPRVGRGLFNTFHADHWFARWPLDHVFVSDHFRVMRLERLPHIGSDHFPMLVEFSMDKNKSFDEYPDRDELDEDLLADTLETEQAKKADTPSMGDSSR